MQQTTNYKLNLIETSDPFSPNPLNENAEKTDAKFAALDAADAALDSRVQVLELRKFAAGTYQGDSQDSQFIDLGFAPQAVFLFQQYSSANQCTALAIAGCKVQYNFGSSYHDALDIEGNGFRVYYHGQFNFTNNTYRYFAMG